MGLRINEAVVAALFLGACNGDDSAADDAASGGTASSDASTDADTGDDGGSSETAGPADSSGEGPASTGVDEDSSGGGSTAADSSGGSSEEGTTGGAMAIPDPGGGAANWISTGDIGTPGTAWPVGIETQDFPYVEGTADGTGLAFFVFEAGLTEITIFATPNDAGVLDSMHMHDGTGLVFGDEIAADDIAPGGGGTWTLTLGNIYVLELRFPGAGFF